MINLRVDRPDPENRHFSHPDPLGWTEQNRHKIVRALYTILIAGARNRRSDQQPKTRFKTWWNLIGWPMEYAASFRGITLDCAELMRRGEVGDEDASAVSIALITLHEKFGIGDFTSRDVAEAFEGRFPVLENAADDLDKPSPSRSAIDLREALSGLVGKRLDNPITAHSIGKLFQKRLVGRPAWIGEGGVVATLKKTTGHNLNTYRIELTKP